MDKRDFINDIAERMRVNGLRKHLRKSRNSFTITNNDDGTSKRFFIEEPDKDILYTKQDVENVCSTMVECILDALQKGERIKINGIVTIKLKFHKSRRVYMPGGYFVETEEKFVPVMIPGKSLVVAAKLHKYDAEIDNLEEDDNEDYDEDDYESEDMADYAMDD